MSIGGALIGGAAGALGSAAAGALSANAAKEMQKRQIEWERERAKNAHQWEVEDLKNAGLNPILSAGGKGATTGGVSAPMPDYSGVANAGAQFMSGLETALKAQKTKSDIDLQASQAKLNNEQTLKTTADTVLAQRNADLISAKEAWQLLDNKEKRVYADNAKLTYGVGIAKDIALGLGSLIGVGGLTAAAVKRIIKNPQEAYKYIQHQRAPAYLPSLDTSRYIK